MKKFLLDEIIERAAPILKDSKFRKVNRAFYRYVGKVFRSIHFYASAFNLERQAVFTLQVAASLPERHPKLPEKMISELWPIVGRRFGPDNSSPEKQYWIADGLEPTLSEVAACLKEQVLPFLDSHASESGLHRIWIASGGQLQGPTLKI